MIFEPLGKHRGNLRAFQGDYGTPVVFLAGKDQGFLQGETVIFVFDNLAIADKEFSVNADDFSFELELEKSEANTLYNGIVNDYIRIPFSAKRYSASGVFLETVLNGFLFIDQTVEWDGELDG